MSKSKVDKEIQVYLDRIRVNGMAAEQGRARSISIGTAFGGTIELSMRNSNGNTSFVLMQPVEVVEFLHQLAGSIGCHLTLRPRNDFASWRSWRDVPGMAEHLIGNNINVPEHELAKQLPAPEQQPGLQPALMIPKEELKKLALANQKKMEKLARQTKSKKLKNSITNKENTED